MKAELQTHSFQDSRLFEAVQLVNAALETWALSSFLCNVTANVYDAQAQHCHAPYDLHVAAL